MSKKVAIVGAGAAGMSCAATLAKHPEFSVTLIDIDSHTGGQATSIPLDQSTHGAGWLNDGVQGGSQIFRHTFQFFRRYGYEPQPVKLQVAFGKGKNFWTNVFPSPLVDQHSAEIKKLSRVLTCIKYLMPILGIMPVKTILRLFRFSTDFSNRMVLPLLALFLGTGNQTPNVSSVLLERLFNDPQMKLWEYDPDTLLPNLPLMYTFPNLNNFYRDWATDLRIKGVDVRLNCNVTIFERGKKGVVLQLQSHEDGQLTGQPLTETFDELVMCCPADESKKLLGQNATWREKYVLGGVKFFNDLTITHSDSNYFQQIFESLYDPRLCAKATTQERKNQIAFAEQEPRSQKDGWLGFRPMYFMHSYESDPTKIEMGFNCSSYQHQFREELGENKPPLSQDQQVFQTIFLNDQEKDLWTWNAIDPSKIISRKWWHQFGHRWQHYLRVVPGMMFINGTNRTLYAGSWTMVNMHEIACISGIAAAYRLGATYEPFDDFAEDFFAKYLLVCHGTRYKKAKAKDV
ncbi:Acyl-CoA N-acyltransferase [Penicillium nucicola]|uniref:Acyl-CoA N-acyltransferase n=1 Tax=Penicillium nucicola TaxID=1850975 RepID=UPI0025450010|nr:Acyl-CoA N-acyltransferase [Penicillium nucicola]KAJ5762577.1 Acyl-CoA N-acyltransferase [Penicillium nucicola]